MTSTPSLSERLRGVVGEAHVLTADADLAPYVTDWRGRYCGAAACVVRPGNTAEVAAVVKICAEAGVPMVPQGGNTSLCGAATPDRSGAAAVISLSRLNRIRSLDILNNTVTVEAGCTLAAVQEAARSAGRLFPLALASEGSCQIGGNLSTNAGGVQVLRYGNTRELTLGLEAVLPDGQVWDGLRGLRKDNTGYDLKHLFIGAEGTLGIVTAAVLKLFPLPQAQVTAWLGLSSPAAAVALLGRAQAAFDARLTAFELVSDTALALVLRHIPGSASPAGRSPWYVLCEFSAGGDEAELRNQVEDWLAGCQERGSTPAPEPAPVLLTGSPEGSSHGPESQYPCGFPEGAPTCQDGIVDAVVAQSETQAKRLWQLRENISEAQKREGISIKHDISVPVSRIPEFLARADAALAAAFPGIRIVAFGHVGDGNLHYNLSQADRQANAEFIACQPEANRRVHDLAHELGGSISAEHGLGQLKREEIRRYKSPVEMALMAAVKRALDPRGLMNPGKIL